MRLTAWNRPLVPVGRLAPRARGPISAFSTTLGRIQATSEWKGPLNNCRKAIVQLEIVFFRTNWYSAFSFKRIVYKRTWVASLPFQSVWATFSSN